MPEIKSMWLIVRTEAAEVSRDHDRGFGLFGKSSNTGWSLHTQRIKAGCRLAALTKAGAHMWCKSAE